jgi:hypothetical protein
MRIDLCELCCGTEDNWDEDDAVEDTCTYCWGPIVVPSMFTPVPNHLFPGMECNCGMMRCQG